MCVGIGVCLTCVDVWVGVVDLEKEAFACVFTLVYVLCVFYIPTLHGKCVVDWLICVLGWLTDY